MESDRNIRRGASLACGLTLVAFFILLTLPVLTRRPGDWVAVYVAAGHNLRAGEDVTAGGTSYVYPPFGALVAVPFGMLPRAAGLAAWAVVNALAAAVLLVAAWRVAGGRRLPGQSGTSRVDVLAFWLGGMLTVGFLLDTAANWQTDIVIGALLVAGCWLLAGGRSVWGGVAIGAAASFKCTPLLFAPYLLWKRRFLAAGAVVAVAVGLNLLPDLAYPPPDGRPRVVAWAERYLSPMAAEKHDPGVWASGIAFNHSLAGVNLRWVAHDRAWVNGSTVGVPRVDRPTASQLKLLNLAAAAALGLVALVALWRRPAEITPGPVFAAELGVVLTLMLLLSPMSSKPHFVVLLLPAFAIVRVGWEHRDRGLMALAVAAAVAGLCTGKDVVGRAAYDTLMWNGLVFFLALAMFLGCCHARFWYGSPRLGQV